MMGLYCFSISHFLSSFFIDISFSFHLQHLLHCFLKTDERPPADYFFKSLADQTVLFDRISQPHSCVLGKNETLMSPW